MKIRVGIAEHPDHFKHAIKEGQVPLPDIELVVHANNGWLLKHELEEKRPTLDIILIDVDMPVMSGVETTVWLRERQPSVKLIAMAEFGFDPKLRKMLIAGCCSFFEKTRAPDEFATAIRRTYSKNYYNPEAEELILWNPFRAKRDKQKLTSEQQRVLDLSCGDLTYDQIQAEMQLTTRQLNKVIDSLFNKFGVNGRNGLVLEALRQDFCSPDISTP